MTNHYHLLIETAQQSLEKVMGRLLSVYAMRFHRVHGSVGYVFQGRYCAKVCARDSYFLRLMRYIHRNPVQAGLCMNAADWFWSGHNELLAGIGGLLDADWPLSYFGESLPEARQGYARFVDDASDDGVSGFLPEQPRLSTRVDLMTIALQVAEDFRMPLERITSGKGRKDVSVAKLELIRRADAEGHQRTEIARLLNCSRSAISMLTARAK